MAPDLQQLVADLEEAQSEVLAAAQDLQAEAERLGSEHPVHQALARFLPAVARWIKVTGDTREALKS